MLEFPSSDEEDEKEGWRTRIDRRRSLITQAGLKSHRTTKRLAIPRARRRQGVKSQKLYSKKGSLRRLMDTERQ